LPGANERNERPQRSPQIRPFMVTPKPAILLRQQDIRCYNPAR
jgi:hypothetical protein